MLGGGDRGFAGRPKEGDGDRRFAGRPKEGNEERLDSGLVDGMVSMLETADMGTGVRGELAWSTTSSWLGVRISGMISC